MNFEKEEVDDLFHEIVKEQLRIVVLSFLQVMQDLVSEITMMIIVCQNEANLTSAQSFVFFMSSDLMISNGQCQSEL